MDNLVLDFHQFLSEVSSTSAPNNASNASFTTIETTTMFHTNFTTTSNGTLTPCKSDTPQYVGYIAVVITSLLFGSNLLPVKKYETGDGVFFQFIQCCTIGAYGVVFNWIIGTPKFEPFAMLGGAMWTTGNMCCVLVIRSIGLGIGLVLWSLQGLILGWASSRFGWFADPVIPAIAWLQYFGVALGAVRGIVSMFIQTNTGEPSSSDRQVLVADDELNNERSNAYDDSVDQVTPQIVNTRAQEIEGGHSSSSNGTLEKGDFITRMAPMKKRLFGISLALFAGTMFGLQFAPTSVVKSKASGCTRDWDYSFAFYCGTFATSLVYTVIYSIAKRNQPFINPQLLVPGFISGLMWVVAQTGWFLANETLSQSVSFPIINTGPPMVAIFWAVVVFREIRGTFNMILLAVTIVLGLASVLMVAFST